MDFYESVVFEYLRADRATFVNTECCVQVNEADNPDQSEPHWYCDAVVANFREQAVFLCEISFSEALSGLYSRLQGWNENWPLVCSALVRDSKLPRTWPVRPWLFVPEDLVSKLVKRVAKLQGEQQQAQTIPDPRITTLEMVQPWRYRSWNRKGEAQKPGSIPGRMQK